MKKQVYTMILLAIASAVGFVMIELPFVHSIGLWLIEAVVTAVSAGIMAVICLITLVVMKRNKKRGEKKSVSPWKLFALIDLVLIVALAAWSVWDMMTDKGFMAGIAGAIGLYYGVPILVALLVVELLVYKTVHRASGGGQSKKTDADGGSSPVDIVKLKKDDWRKKQ